MSMKNIVNGIAAAATLAGTVKAMFSAAVDDTDGDGIPQYQNVVAKFEAIKARAPQRIAVLKEDAKLLKEAFDLGVGLFKHVMEQAAKK